MKGKKVFHLRANYDELTDIKDGLDLLFMSYEKDEADNSAQRVKKTHDEIELIQRR